MKPEPGVPSSRLPRSSVGASRPTPGPRLTTQVSRSSPSPGDKRPITTRRPTASTPIATSRSTSLKPTESPVPTAGRLSPRRTSVAAPPSSPPAQTASKPQEGPPVVPEVNEEVQAQLADARATEQALAAKVASLERAYGELQTRLKQKDDELQAMSAEVERQKDVAAKASLSLKDTQESVQSLKKEVQAQKDELEIVNATNEELVIDKDISEEMISTLELQVKELNQNLEQLSIEKTVIQEDLNKLLQNDAGARDAHAVKMQCEKLKDALRRLHEKSTEEKETLEKKLSDAEARASECEMLRGKVTALEPRVKELEEEGVDLRAQLEAAEEIEEIVNSLTEKNTQLEEDVEKLQNEVKELETARDELQEMLDLSQEFEAEMKEEKIYLETELLNRERDIERLQLSLDDREATIQRFRTRLETELHQSTELKETQEEQHHTKSRLESQHRTVLLENLSLWEHVRKSKKDMLITGKRYAEALGAARSLTLLQECIPSDVLEADAGSRALFALTESGRAKCSTLVQALREYTQPPSHQERDQLPPYLTADEISRVIHMQFLLIKLHSLLDTCHMSLEGSVDAVTYVQAGELAPPVTVAVEALDTMFQVLVSDGRFKNSFSRMNKDLNHCVDVMSRWRDSGDPFPAVTRSLMSRLQSAATMATTLAYAGHVVVLFLAQQLQNRQSSGSADPTEYETAASTRIVIPDEFGPALHAAESLKCSATSLLAALKGAPSSLLASDAGAGGVSLVAGCVSQMEAASAAGGDALQALVSAIRQSASGETDINDIAEPLSTVHSHLSSLQESFLAASMGSKAAQSDAKASPVKTRAEASGWKERGQQVRDLITSAKDIRLQLREKTAEYEELAGELAASHQSLRDLQENRALLEKRLSEFRMQSLNLDAVREKKDELERQLRRTEEDLVRTKKLKDQAERALKQRGRTSVLAQPGMNEGDRVRLGALRDALRTVCSAHTQAKVSAAAAVLPVDSVVSPVPYVPPPTPDLDRAMRDLNSKLASSSQELSQWMATPRVVRLSQKTRPARKQLEGDGLSGLKLKLACDKLADEAGLLLNRAKAEGYVVPTLGKIERLNSAVPSDASLAAKLTVRRGHATCEKEDTAGANPAPRAAALSRRRTVVRKVVLSPAQFAALHARML